MDVKSAFNNVRKAHLGRHMKRSIRSRTSSVGRDSFTSDRQVKLALDAEKWAK